MPSRKIESPKPVYRAPIIYAFIGRLLPGTEPIVNKLQERAGRRNIISADGCLVLPLTPLTAFRKHKNIIAELIDARRRVGINCDVRPLDVTFSQTKVLPRATDDQELFDVHVPIIDSSATSLKAQMECIRTALHFRSAVPSPTIEILSGASEGVAFDVAQHVGQLLRPTLCLSPPDVYTVKA